MTEETMKTMLTSMTDETDDGVLSAYLEFAEQEALNRLYPFGIPEEATLPSRYHGVQVRIAAFHLNNRGAEGEISHVENGINRMYENGSTPMSLLREITPMAGTASLEVEHENP